MNAERRCMAESWVNCCTEAAVDTVLATALVPVLVQMFCAALKATMCYLTGRTYKRVPGPWAKRDGCRCGRLSGICRPNRGIRSGNPDRFFCDCDQSRYCGKHCQGNGSAGY